VRADVRLGGTSAGAAQHLNASAAALLAQRRGLFYNQPLQLGVGDRHVARDAMRASLGFGGDAPRTTAGVGNESAADQDGLETSMGSTRRSVVN